ncbi:hypothetical protein ABHV46_10690 [Asaia sp. BMEF1]|uniref:hypothetical protein n=1 Tax=Asaia sp. BMEF1 TaxID=3155932 RepID=UPI003F6636BF
MSTVPKTTLLSVVAAASTAAAINYVPDWKSYQQTGNPADIVSSPTVASAIGTKVDAVNGQAQGLQIQGGTQTVTAPALDRGASIANTLYVDRATANLTASLRADLSQLGFLNTYSNTVSVCGSGCDYTRVSDAVPAAIAMAHRFTTTGVIQVMVSDGTYNETNQVFTNDPYGRFVQVIGDTTNPANVVLNFTNTKGTNLGGFSAYNGGRFGLIDGMTITTPADGTGALASVDSSGRNIWNAQSYGAAIQAYGAGSAINLGSHLIVSNFYYGLVADNNAGIDAPSGGVSIIKSGDANAMARGGGVIVCTPCTATDASDYTTPSTAVLGSNFIAERGGSLYIDGSTASKALVNGILALSNGAGWAHNVSLTGGLNNAGNGFAVWEGGVLELTGSSATKYTNGVSAQNYSYASVDGMTLNANAVGIMSDGGRIEGSGATITNNTSYGIQALHQGSVVMYGTVSKMSGNAANFGQQASGTQSASNTTYTASSIDVQ